jgi:chromosome segregation ATPase
MDRVSTERSALLVEERNLDGALKSLWERARRAGEAIASLREENATLRSRLAELEGELGTLRTEVRRKDAAINELRAAQSEAEHQAVLVSNGDRDALVARVKLLLAKLESYL